MSSLLTRHFLEVRVTRISISGEHPLDKIPGLYIYIQTKGAVELERSGASIDYISRSYTQKLNLLYSKQLTAILQIPPSFQVQISLATVLQNSFHEMDILLTAVLHISSKSKEAELSLDASSQISLKF